MGRLAGRTFHRITGRKDRSQLPRTRAAWCCHLAVALILSGAGGSLGVVLSRVDVDARGRGGPSGVSGGGSVLRRSGPSPCSGSDAVCRDDRVVGSGDTAAPRYKHDQCPCREFQWHRCGRRLVGYDAVRLPEATRRSSEFTCPVARTPSSECECREQRGAGGRCELGNRQLVFTARLLAGGWRCRVNSRA